MELDLIKGTHQNQNKHPSIIHFSLNKAATQYTGGILQQCAAENGMVPVSIHEYAFHTNFPYLDHLTEEEMGKYKHIFKPNGYLYSVFGGMIEGISELDKYKIVLMVRDFRDVLVSEYYSTAYSHVAPERQGNRYDLFVEQRTKAMESGIDEYAVAESDRVNNILQRYKTLLIDKYPNVYVTKYEEMVNDFRGWLDKLLHNCELNIGHEFFEALLERNERIRPKVEDIHSHLRKGKSGEYKEKLKQETIEFLNMKFSPMLLNFGYKLDSCR
ncbi:MAG: sulfotransferase [Gammaproteobacteria bacterium]|nr:sulfotransferase [Gammaproteobacteria bacterium]